MGLTAKYKPADVQQALDRGAKQIERSILRIFSRAGENFVREARLADNITGVWKQRKLTDAELASGRTAPNYGDYLDDTDNLRSSIGFGVYLDGVPYVEDLDGTPEGVAAARTALNAVPKRGWQLIGVAGMEYASHVESKGYNVITSQGDIAIVQLKVDLRSFREKMNRMGKGVEYGSFDEDMVKTMTR
jgi:hypothetical protein